MLQVLAGTKENVQKFVEICKNNNMKTHVLDSSHAFHSRLMNPMLEKYEEIASTIDYNKKKNNKARNNCTFISGMEGKIMNNNKIDAGYWVKHTRDRVRFRSK